MNGLDLVIVVLLGVGIVRGAATGFFSQAGSIVGILAAFALGIRLMIPAGAYLTRTVGVSESVGPVIGFIAVFAAVYLIVAVVAKVAEEAAGALKLGFVNRGFGGAVGGLKAALLLSVAFVGLSYIEMPPMSTRDSSVLYQPIATVLPTAWAYVSDNAQALDALSRKIEERIEPAGGSPSPAPEN
jgi:membrane protein required for colicin V production